MGERSVNHPKAEHGSLLNCLMPSAQHTGLLVQPSGANK